MTAYYQLRCATCDDLFKPLVSTEPNELLCPDYAEVEQGGYNLTSLLELLRAFHDDHQGHALETVDAEWTRARKDDDDTERLELLRLP